MVQTAKLLKIEIARVLSGYFFHSPSPLKLPHSLLLFCGEQSFKFLAGDVPSLPYVSDYIHHGRLTRNMCGYCPTSSQISHAGCRCAGNRCRVTGNGRLSIFNPHFIPPPLSLLHCRCRSALSAVRGRVAGRRAESVPRCCRVPSAAPAARRC